MILPFFESDIAHWFENSLNLQVTLKLKEPNVLS